jgi:hypothetical protein
VESLVLEQAWPLAEGPTTLITFVRFLTCVCSLVLNKDGILGEAFSTFITDIGSLCWSIDPLPFQLAFIVTGISTIGHLSNITIQFSRYFFKRLHFFSNLPLCGELCIPSPSLTTWNNKWIPRMLFSQRQEKSNQKSE